MITRTKVVLILVVILAQLAWLIRPRVSLHGEVLDESYRHDERFATLVAKSQHPSAETEAAFNREVDLLHAHTQRRVLAHLALLLAVNGAGIYFFLHHGTRKTNAHMRHCELILPFAVFASYVKALIFLSSLVVTCSGTTVLGSSRDMALTNKVSSLPVVAEVRIERIEVRPDPPNKFEDLLCDCEVLQPFKLPFATNRLTLKMNFAAPAAKYEGKKALIFCFEARYGHYSPYGGKHGFILETEKYYDPFAREEIAYGELIRRIKAAIQANPQGGANGGQLSGSNTNRTPAAATPRPSH